MFLNFHTQRTHPGQVAVVVNFAVLVRIRERKYVDLQEEMWRRYPLPTHLIPVRPGAAGIQGAQSTFELLFLSPAAPGRRVSTAIINIRLLASLILLCISPARRGEPQPLAPPTAALVGATAAPVAVQTAVSRLRRAPRHSQGELAFGVVGATLQPSQPSSGSPNSRHACTLRGRLSMHARPTTQPLSVKCSQCPRRAFSSALLGSTSGSASGSSKAAEVAACR